MRHIFASLLAVAIVVRAGAASADAQMPNPQFSFALAPPIRDGQSLRAALDKVELHHPKSSDEVLTSSGPTTLGFVFALRGDRLEVVQRSETAEGSLSGLLAITGAYLRVSGPSSPVAYEQLDGPELRPLGVREGRARGTPLAALATAEGLSVVVRPTGEGVPFVHVLEGAGQGKDTAAFETSSTIAPIGVFPCQDRYVALYESVDGAARSLRLRELRPDGTPFEPLVDTSLDSLAGRATVTQVSVACDATRRSVMMLNTGRGIVEAFRDGGGGDWKVELRDAGAPSFAHAVHDGSAYLLTESTATVAATFSAFGKATFARRVSAPIHLAGLACSSEGCVATGRNRNDMEAFADVVALGLPIAPGEGDDTLTPNLVVLDRVGAEYASETSGCATSPGTSPAASGGVFLAAALGLFVARRKRR